MISTARSLAAPLYMILPSSRLDIVKVIFSPKIFVSSDVPVVFSENPVIAGITSLCIILRPLCGASSGFSAEPISWIVAVLSRAEVMNAGIGASNVSPAGGVTVPPPPPPVAPPAVSLPDPVTVAASSSAIVMVAVEDSGRLLIVTCTLVVESTPSVIVALTSAIALALSGISIDTGTGLPFPDDTSSRRR